MVILHVLEAFALPLNGKPDPGLYKRLDWSYWVHHLLRLMYVEIDIAE